jgi:hypothetical protein
VRVIETKRNNECFQETILKDMKSLPSEEARVFLKKQDSGELISIATSPARICG